MGELRLGVFGGTFNPIHLGHLHVARRILWLFRLSRIYFVVATSPPHKRPEDLVPFIHRYTMVGLALAALPWSIPSPVELERPASPFSVHTMAKFARRHRSGSGNLYFIAGGDSLLDVAGWRKSGDLLASCNFIFVTRPGVNMTDAGMALPAGARQRILDLRGLPSGKVRSRIEAAAQGDESRIYVVDAGAPDISSSRVRRLAAAGRSIRKLVPASVDRYIQKLNLYGE